MRVVRWGSPASLVGLGFVLLLVSGCAGKAGDGHGFSLLQQEQADGVEGSQTASGTCGTDATLAISYTQAGGSWRVKLHDADDRLVYDSGPRTGAASAASFTGAAAGTAGAWTLTVERDAFAGSYAVQVSC